MRRGPRKAGWSRVPQTGRGRRVETHPSPGRALGPERPGRMRLVRPGARPARERQPGGRLFDSCPFSYLLRISKNRTIRGAACRTQRPMMATLELFESKGNLRGRTVRLAPQKPVWVGAGLLLFRQWVEHLNMERLGVLVADTPESRGPRSMGVELAP